MKRITLIGFGKLRTPGLEEAVQELMKRLGRYTNFTFVEMKAQPIPEKSDALRTQIREKEACLILDKIASPAFKATSGNRPELWCLDETGRAQKTTEWAKQLKTLATHGSGELVIVIGGSLGLGQALLKSANQVLSFGPQTFSHELARLVTVEQLYRALSYNEGHPYHNEG